MYNHYTKHDLLLVEQIMPGLNVKVGHPTNEWTTDKKAQVRSTAWLKFYPEWNLTLITFYAMIEGEIKLVAAKYVLLDMEA